MNTTTQKTPGKYYGGQLANTLEDTETSFVTGFSPAFDSIGDPDSSPAKYIVGCDWLELYLKGDLSYLKNLDSYEKGAFRLVANDTITKYYSCSRTVYYAGELFGVILFQPRSKVLAVESISFKIDNQQLYKRKEIDLKIGAFLRAFEIEFCNYTRVDLFIDFNRFNSKLGFADFVTAYSAGQIASKGKVQSFNKYHSRVDGNMRLTGFSYGSRSSDKYIRCYDKTYQLEIEHKPYIQEFWQLNGFSKTDRVYRFEIQLNSKFFNKTDGQRLKLDGTRAYGLGNSREVEKDGKKSWEYFQKRFSISNKDSILNLLQLAMTNYFEFFDAEDTRKKTSDRLPVELFDWSQLREGVKRMYSYVRKKITHTSVTWRQKMIVLRNMFREYVVNFQDEKWLYFVARLIHDYNLQHRWQKVKERYTLEFLKMLGELYLFDWKKMESSLNSYMLELKVDTLKGQKRFSPAGVQGEFIPVLSVTGNYILTQIR